MIIEDDLPTRRESIIPETRETDDELEVAEPMMVENVRQLKAWMEHDPQAVSDMFQDLKATYLDNLIRHGNAVGKMECFRDRINQLEGIVEYQKEELREARRQATKEPTREPPRPRSPSHTPSTQVTDGTDKKKSMKLPDPPIFTDGKEISIDHWLTKMRSKLAANDDHMPTEVLKKAYVENQVGGEAMGHLEPRLRKGAIRPFTTAEEMFDQLERIYGDPNRKRTAMNNFRSLKQGSKDFNTFWAEFQRLAAELDHNEETLIGELKYKLSWEMSRQLATGDLEPTDLYEFAQKCQRLYQSLKESDRSKASMERFAEKRASMAQSTPSTSATRTTTTATTKTYVPPRPTSNPSTPRTTYYMSDEEKERLTREGRCFFCKETGHLSRDCEKKKNRPARIQEIAEEANSGKE